MKENLEAPWLHGPQCGFVCQLCCGWTGCCNTVAVIIKDKEDLLG